MKRVRTLPRLAPRPSDAHKGDFGKVLVVGTSPGLVGAGCLAANAALRSGAGLVTLGTPRSIWPIAAAKLTAAMTLPLPETSDGALGPQAREAILSFLADADVLALGLGSAHGRKTDSPPLVLTPHPGEMARLAGIATAKVTADREGVASATAKEWNAVVVLKGHRTVVTDGDRVFVNHTGNPGMATGGTGDVLTGVVAALLGQRLLGLDAFQAAAIAVRVHGRAGDLAKIDRGEISMTAEDLLDHLHLAFRIELSFRSAGLRGRS
ncbi:MAG: NAD(P)H-hydrate dehydratase [Planctomycetes bacterium]|nr:NAD(P)H-hydrate dehydratase [Planctomycetota bacterium]